MVMLKGIHLLAFATGISTSGVSVSDHDIGNAVGAAQENSGVYCGVKYHKVCQFDFS